MFIRVVNGCSRVISRSLSFSPAYFQQGQATDPVQQLFVEKIRDYAKKQKAQTDPDSLVDANADQTKSYNDELERIRRIYNITKGENVAEFPKVEMKDPAFPAFVEVKVQEKAEKIDDTPVFDDKK